MAQVKTVDDYIKSAPKEVQDRLKELRKVIKEVAPTSEERMSYAMPAYKYHGWLAYFAYWEKHIGLYGIKETVRQEFKDDLMEYEMAKGTIQFPLDQKLPLGLIKKLVKAQAKLNEKK